MKSPTRTDNHSMHLQWEPGNGTRYDVIITHLEQSFMGHGVGIYLVTVSDSPRPTAFFVAKDGGYIVHHWVSEKTGLNAHDASVVTEMVGAALERPIGVIEEDWYRERVPVPFAEVYKPKGSQ